jgi:hypothetical protein
VWSATHLDEALGSQLAPAVGVHGLRGVPLRPPRLAAVVHLPTEHHAWNTRGLPCWCAVLRAGCVAGVAGGPGTPSPGCKDQRMRGRDGEHLGAATWSVEMWTSNGAWLAEVGSCCRASTSALGTFTRSASSGSFSQTPGCEMAAQLTTIATGEDSRRHSSKPSPVARSTCGSRYRCLRTRARVQHEAKHRLPCMQLQLGRRQPALMSGTCIRPAASGCALDSLRPDG